MDVTRRPTYRILLSSDFDNENFFPTINCLWKNAQPIDPTCRIPLLQWSVDWEGGEPDDYVDTVGYGNWSTRIDRLSLSLAASIFARDKLQY